MTCPSRPSPVPPFHSLGNGTVEQTLHQRNSSRNGHGTSSLKVLANKVLDRNKDWNKPGTAPSKPVPPIPQSSSVCGTNAEVGCKIERDNFLYDFEERLAIAEYDGEQSPVQAQRIAYFDAFMTVLANLAHEDVEDDWMEHRIQAAQAWLLAQGIEQPE